MDLKLSYIIIAAGALNDGANNILKLFPSTLLI